MRQAKFSNLIPVVPENFPAQMPELKTYAVLKDYAESSYSKEITRIVCMHIISIQTFSPQKILYVLKKLIEFWSGRRA